MSRKSVSGVVSEVLDEMQFLHLPFEQGLANCSSVARLISPLVAEKLGAPAGRDAVIAAVRRYASTVKKRDNSSVASIVAGSNAILRTGMFGVHIKNWHNPGFMNGLSKLVTEQVDWNSGEKVYISQRSAEMYVCVCQRVLPKLLAIASKPPTEMGHYQENLALITIDHPPIGRSTPGLLAFFINILAHANINIYEIFSTHRKFSLLFDEKDAPKAYAVVSKAISLNKKLFAQPKQQPVAVAATV